jgi:hypothetical protein
VSPGGHNCYAERFSERFRGVLGHPFENGFDLTLKGNKQHAFYPLLAALRELANLRTDTIT